MPLQGEIAVKGAKNAALKLIPASLLSKEEITVTNLPQIEDIDKSLKISEELGAKVERRNHTVIIRAENINSGDLNAGLAGKFRASIMFAAPLLARTGEASFPVPGGCNLASGAQRPINLFLDGFKKFGVEIEENNKYFKLKTSGLKGCEIFFPLISVTATEAMVMAAVLAEGVTVLKNCAMEPEIQFLADYLNSCGARIEGAGTPTIKIKGVKEINAKEVNLIPDRIETGSFAILAALTNSELTITDCEPAHIEILLKLFAAIGIPFEAGKNIIKMKKHSGFKACNIKTHEYPGFPTDLQSPFTVLMTQAEGSSLIHETIYDRRLMFTDSLMQMGAQIIMCDPHRVVINGPNKLYGKKLASPDLRAGISLLLAGLIAEGTTEISNIYQIDRGYERIDERLNTLGAKINRTN